MKCPHCGGEVSVNDRKCPYCGTDNPEGVAFHDEVHRRRRFNEYLKAKTKEQMMLPLAQRIMNLILLVLFLILLFLFILYLGISLIQENAFSGFMRPKDYDSQLTQMYEEGRYGELNAAMREWDIPSEDYPEYTQLTILHNSYENFLYHSMNCTQAMDQKILPDDYHLEYSILYAQELLCPNIYAYPDIYPENQQVLKPWQDEIRIYLINMLGFTEEEFSSLYPEDEYDYFSYAEQEALLEAVKSRMKEAGYHEENN